MNKASLMHKKKRIRRTVIGSPAMPRLSVYRSNKYIYTQLIDDQSGHTLASADDRALKSQTKTERAKHVGRLIAEQASTKNITYVKFDRGGWRYHGRIKAVAEGARAAGLQF